MAPTQRFTVLDPRFAVCRMSPGSTIPGSPAAAEFWSLSITRDEISLVCEESLVPSGCTSIERTWRAIKVLGPLDFSLQGVMASLVGPLAEMHLGVFVVSTYDTDYVLVKEFDLEPAVRTLQAAGHELVS